MGNLTIAFTFVMVMNVLMFVAQASVLNLDPNSTVFYNEEGQLMSEFDAGNNTLATDDSFVKENLPGGSGTVTTDTDSNWVTDTVNAIKNWFSETLGLKYITQVLSAPYLMLEAMHLPQEIAFALGSLWYGITFFVGVAFILNRAGA